jgi:hypothetical protein
MPDARYRYTLPDSALKLELPHIELATTIMVQRLASDLGGILIVSNVGYY